MSTSYFCGGYGIAAGYGYVDDPKTEELFERIKVRNIRFTPEVVEPLTDAIPYALRPPGLSLVVAGINRILGMRADVPVQILGILLDTLAAGITFWIGRSCLGWKTGFIGGLIFAIFPPLAYTSICKIPCGLLSFFIVTFLACTLRATRLPVGACVYNLRRLGLHAPFLAIGRCNDCSTNYCFSRLATLGIPQSPGNGPLGVHVYRRGARVGNRVGRVR
jgi:4-amino-4-deoxy-L-arabinose transferase-like glycosyltransferase